MSKDAVYWLPHLEKSIPKEAYGYSVSMYSIALEGWRRGLELRFVNKNRLNAHTEFILSNGKKQHRFTVSRGDAVPSSAIKICIDKNKTKNYLVKSQVPTPEGKLFMGETDDREIISSAKKLGFPLVLKPLDGTGGHGVIANIKNEDEFVKALTYVRQDLSIDNVIVERYFKGEDIRIYVVNNKVIGAIKRIPANVVGDGERTIAQLLRIKNNFRRHNPALKASIIKKDKEMSKVLNEQGYTLESVPKKGERVYLKTKNNVSSGGDPIDVTEELTDEIKQIAIKASKSIPGLVQCGVDVMVNKENNTGVVIEVNSRPSIRSHLFPIEGQARDIPKAIIDYYFPDTKPNDNCPLYFDIKHVFESFKNGFAKQITIPNIPKVELILTRFVLSGKFSKKYDLWIQKLARRLNLNGYIKTLSDTKRSIVLCGNNVDIEKFRKAIKGHSSKMAKLNYVIEKPRKTPVKMGFEIINEEKSVLIRSQQTDVKKERDYYYKKYHEILNSRSWKITKPLRSLLKKKR